MGTHFINFAIFFAEVCEFRFCPIEEGVRTVEFFWAAAQMSDKGKDCSAPQIDARLSFFCPGERSKQRQIAPCAKKIDSAG